MKKLKYAAASAALLSHALAVGSPAASVEDEQLDEVVVVGRNITTGIAEVEVEREMLVDTATVLKEIPGANVNANGALTGIAQ